MKKMSSSFPATPPLRPKPLKQGKFLKIPSVTYSCPLLAHYIMGCRPLNQISRARP